MTAITRFEEIEAWQTARKLTVSSTTVTNKMDLTRILNYVNQIRRAVFP